ncbi:hypothetical protein OUZ56_007250 [Daphnia magna]|uniref:Uncharacterized protein n=1 Tax=Daphnia magna TaxID=35525 RepID=A0ABQ9YY67_9CRUS|nr:hypothetical protein OUZ56_007250 [Daphnia magna]
MNPIEGSATAIQKFWMLVHSRDVTIHIRCCIHTPPCPAKFIHPAVKCKKIVMSEKYHQGYTQFIRSFFRYVSIAITVGLTARLVTFLISLYANI